MPIYKAEKGKHIHSAAGVIRFDSEYYQTENEAEMTALANARGVEKLSEAEAKKVEKVKKSNAKKTKKAKEEVKPDAKPDESQEAAKSEGDQDKSETPGAKK
jgi:hypothetical protein